MEAYIFEWLNLLLRWLHVITAIAWIGSSFYFVWLDNSLTKPQDPELREKGVGGELWAVHGGGFYNPQKYLLAPKTLPQNLHWFFWESYSTWLSGFALFSVLYLFNAKTFLVDKHVLDMTATTAVFAALGYLVAGWVVYDAICRLLGDKPGGDRVVGVLVTIYVVAAVWVACHVFSGRAAFLMTGASLASMRAGQSPDPIHGKRGKQRSVHNTYFTLPVIFAMLSNHYSMTYSAGNNWLVLLLIMLAGVLIRQFFVLKHKSIFKWQYPAAAVVVLAGVAAWIAPKSALQSAPAAAQGAPAVSFAQVQQVIETRCIQCHAAKPTLMPVPGKGILLDSKDAILQHAQQIYQQAVVQKAMPLGNMTNITDDERALLGKWFEAGAKGE